MRQTVEEALDRLERSSFRAGFRLSKKDVAYVREKGMETIEKHAADFVRGRIAAAEPENDGRQTPMSGHPAFKAMHATACCCRGCLNKWYHVPKHRELTEDEQRRIVKLMMAWIARQMKKTDNV